MNNFSKKYGKWALITGASSGIDLEFSRQIAAKGLNDLGTSGLSVPGLVNKFLYCTGKYLQPRRLNTAMFGFVFRNVFREKLERHGHSLDPQSSIT